MIGILLFIVALGLPGAAAAEPADPNGSTWTMHMTGRALGRGTGVDGSDSAFREDYDTLDSGGGAETRFEGHDARRTGPGRYEIDGQVVESYTFSQDYYFAMGDNRDNSLDSRFWGFVPEEHVCSGTRQDWVPDRRDTRTVAPPRAMAKIVTLAMKCLLETPAIFRELGLNDLTIIQRPD